LLIKLPIRATGKEKPPRKLCEAQRCTVGRLSETTRLAATVCNYSLTSFLEQEHGTS